MMKLDIIKLSSQHGQMVDILVSIVYTFVGIYCWDYIFASFFKGICDNLHVHNLKGSKTRSNTKWNLDVQFGQWMQNFTRISDKCGKGEAWFGWNEGTDEGEISTKLFCNGIGTLSFGNCGTGGTVTAYLQDIEIGSSNENAINNEIIFEFKSTDVLKLKEKGQGSIIQFNSFHARPKGF